jgi:hypothetical protein
VLAAHGIPLRISAKTIGIDEKTLKKHFRDEVRDAREMLTAQMGLSIVRAGLNGDWRAAAYWLALFGGPQWRKPKHIAVSGTVHVTTDRPDVSQMSDEDLRASIAELKRQQEALAEARESKLH